MNAKPEIQPEEIEKLIALVNEANHVASSAASMSAERLRKCVQVGSILTKWKEAIPKGQWQTWIDSHLPPDLNERTRQRWMKLSTLDAQGRLDLESARGLRHAYQLAQLLPEGDSTGTKQTTSKPSYLTHLARLIASLHEINVQNLTQSERTDLKQRLAPLVVMAETL